MAATEGSVNYDGGKLHFIVSGRGPKHLLCFHGFGQSKEVLLPLVAVLEQQYTLYLFDIFHHGKSVLDNATVLNNNYTNQLFTLFFDRFRVQKFSVLGFSIGARLALSLLEVFPEKTEKLFLLAPDGFTNNLWYRVSTSTLLGRKLFQHFIKNHHYLKKIIQSLSNLKILPRKIGRFVSGQLTEKETSERVYKTWVSFRKLKFSTKDLVNKINTHQISVYFYLGKYDTIIKEKSIIPVSNKIYSSRIFMLHAGHSNLIEATARFFEKEPNETIN